MTDIMEKLLQDLWDGEITVETLLARERSAEADRIYTILEKYLDEKTLKVLRYEIIRGVHEPI